MTGRLSSMEAARQLKATGSANEAARRQLEVVAVELGIAALTGSQTPEMLRVFALRLRDKHRASKAYAEALEARNDAKKPKRFVEERRGRERKSA